MHTPADFPYPMFDTGVLRLVIPGRKQSPLLAGAWFWATRDPDEPTKKLHLSLSVPLDLARLEQLPIILKPGTSFEVHCETGGRKQTFSPCSVTWAEQRPLHNVTLNTTGRNSVEQVFGLGGFAEGWSETP